VSEAPHSNSRYMHGCRCDICKADHSAWSKVYSRAVRKAGTRFRQENPDRWEDLLQESYEHFGRDRRPRGRQPGEWSM